MQRANAGEIYKWQQNMLSRVLFYANAFKVIVHLKQTQFYKRMILECNIVALSKHSQAFWQSHLDGQLKSNYDRQILRHIFQELESH